MWPFRRGREAPAPVVEPAPEPAGWETLPPLPATVGPLPPTFKVGSAVKEDLTALRSPRLSSGLGHFVSPDGPSGSVTGLVTPSTSVQRRPDTSLDLRHLPQPTVQRQAEGALEADPSEVDSPTALSDEPPPVRATLGNEPQVQRQATTAGSSDVAPVSRALPVDPTFIPPARPTEAPHPDLLPVRAEPAPAVVEPVDQSELDVPAAGPDPDPEPVAAPEPDEFAIVQRSRSTRSTPVQRSSDSGTGLQRIVELPTVPARPVPGEAPRSPGVQRRELAAEDLPPVQRMTSEVAGPAPDIPDGALPIRPIGFPESPDLAGPAGSDVQPTAVPIPAPVARPPVQRSAAPTSPATSVQRTEASGLGPIGSTSVQRSEVSGSAPALSPSVLRTEIPGSAATGSSSVQRSEVPGSAPAGLSSVQRPEVPVGEAMPVRSTEVPAALPSTDGPVSAPTVPLPVQLTEGADMPIVPLSVQRTDVSAVRPTEAPALAATVPVLADRLVGTSSPVQRSVALGSPPLLAAPPVVPSAVSTEPFLVQRSVASAPLSSSVGLPLASMPRSAGSELTLAAIQRSVVPVRSEPLPVARQTAAPEAAPAPEPPALEPIVAPPPEPTPAPAPAPAPAAAAPAAAAAATGDLDELARKLYDRIRWRLRAELRLDLERAGLAAGLRR